MSNKLTVLIIPMDAFGHVYPAVGIGQQLLQKGHRVVFAIDQTWKGKLVKYGFEEELFSVYTEEENKKASEYWIKLLIETGILQNKTPLEKISLFKPEQVFEKIKKSEPFIDKILEKIQPEVTISDTFMAVPSVVQRKIWINFAPFCPNEIKLDENSPPPYSGNFIFNSLIFIIFLCLGLPSNDRTHWKEFIDRYEKIDQDNKQIMIEWFRSRDVTPPLKEGWISPVSPHLNIYSYPKEIDFTDLRLLPENWVRFDSFIRNEGEPFEIPEKLNNKPGKLIYFSLGSIGSSDVKLMKRLIGFISESQHPFIVSKGMFGDKIQLPDNCWGENHVPQTKVLEIIDLAIIHGGNNSLCEVFYFGKPMIVMPLFFDQYDNAQRVDEKGYGIRLKPYQCTKEQLLNSIEKLLDDEELNKKIKEASKRMHNDIKSSKLVEIIEDLVRNVN